MLAPLSKLSEPPPRRILDVRGWGVRTLVDDAAVGTVHELLFDAAAGALRYLDVALGDAAGAHILVPVGQVRAECTLRVVWLPGFSQRQLAGIPAFQHGRRGPSRAYEAALLAAYTAALVRRPPPVATPLHASAGRDFYDDTRFDARELFEPEDEEC